MTWIEVRLINELKEVSNTSDKISQKSTVLTTLSVINRNTVRNEIDKKTFTEPMCLLIMLERTTEKLPLGGAIVTIVSACLCCGPAELILSLLVDFLYLHKEVNTMTGVRLRQHNKLV
jgi:hypothetical protein